MTNQIQQTVISDVAQQIFDTYRYLQVDTSTILPSKTAVELTNGGTQIGNSSALFNKIRELSPLVSFRSANKAIMQFNLESGEPYSQPVNLGSFALMSQQTAGGGMGFATSRKVQFTKTNELKARIRGQITVLRLNEVQ